MRKMGFSFGRTEARFGQGEAIEKKGDFSSKQNRWDDAVEKGGKDAGSGSQKQIKDANVTTDASSVYSDEALTELKFMIEEEKLAGDIYDVFYATYGVKIFKNIGASEDKHFDAVSDYAVKIGLDVDAFVFKPAGEFENPDLQDLYDTLLAQGMESLNDALKVGVTIENKDIVDIAAAAEAVGGTPLADIYGNLLDASYNHLDAFEALLA